MLNSKLLDYLRATSPAERRRLAKAVQSPFFTTNPQVVKLYDLLASHAPFFNSEVLVKEAVFARLFPAHSYSDIKLRNLMTELMAVVEQCFVAIEVEGSTVWKRMLAQSLNKRSLVGYFEKTVQATLDELEAATANDIDTVREKMQLRQAQYYHPAFKKIEHPERLQDLISEMEALHLAERTRLACDEVVMKKAIAGYSVSKERDVLEIQPFAKLYQLVLQLLEAGDETKFMAAKAWFEGNQGHLGKDDLQFGLMHLLNYCIAQHNKGQPSYNEQILGLYKLGLQGDTLLENGWITATMYLNIAATASALGEFHWADTFISGFATKVEPGLRQPARQLAMAHQFFFQQNFSAAIDAMQGLQTMNVDQDLIARMLLLRCYFELFLKDQSFAGLCLANCTANEKFLKRKKNLNAAKAERFLNLIALLKRVVRLISKGKWNHTQRDAHIAAAQHSPNMSMKTWFTERLELL